MDLKKFRLVHVNQRLRRRSQSAAAADNVSAAVVGSAPYNHFTTSRDCGVKISAIWRANGTGRRPNVSARIVPGSAVKIIDIATAPEESAPDDHFAADPHSRVR